MGAAIENYSFIIDTGKIIPITNELIAEIIAMNTRYTLENI